MKLINLDARDDIALIAINDPIVTDGNINLDIWGIRGSWLVLI